MDNNNDLNYSNVIVIKEADDRISEITIYPNPVKEKITIEFFNLPSSVKLDFFNIEAKKILSLEKKN